MARARSAGSVCVSEAAMSAEVRVAFELVCPIECEAIAAGEGLELLDLDPGERLDGQHGLAEARDVGVRRADVGHAGGKLAIVVQRRALLAHLTSRFNNKNTFIWTARDPPEAPHAGATRARRGRARTKPKQAGQNNAAFRDKGGKTGVGLEDRGPPGRLCAAPQIEGRMKDPSAAASRNEGWIVEDSSISNGAVSKLQGSGAHRWA